MLNILKPCAALFIISAIAAASLGYVSEVTKEPIAEAALKAKQDKMTEVLDCSNWNEEVMVEGDSIIKSYTAGVDKANNLVGYAFSIETKGFSSGFNLMIGIDADGIITGVAVVSDAETAGLGANAKKPEWSDQFKGKSGQLEVGTDIDSITGATITSRAVTHATNEVSTYFETNLKGGAK